MSRSTSPLLVLALALGCVVPAWAEHPGIGRAATADEIRAWDIDVRPDFKDLPRGSGSVARGEELWEAKCASCHGSFGESNAYFPPIAGGVTAEDIKAGRVAALSQPGEQRTTLMKLSQLSTLWDYVNRAMPWNAPKSLATDEVYALVAYILNFEKIVPDDFVLSDANIAEVQKRLPNRNGMTREHGLWELKGKPDVKAQACMRDCPVQAKVISRLPESAKDNHGNLAEQNRLIGPVRGLGVVLSRNEPSPAPNQLAEKTGCLACHAAAAKLVGPSFAEVARKYRAVNGADIRLAAKIREGGYGVWGAIPMPAHPQLSESELRSLVQWVLATQ